jgi:hypothetical protein
MLVFNKSLPNIKARTVSAQLFVRPDRWDPLVSGSVGRRRGAGGGAVRSGSPTEDPAAAPKSSGGRRHRPHQEDAACRKRWG